MGHHEHDGVTRPHRRRRPLPRRLGRIAATLLVTAATILVGTGVAGAGGYGGDGGDGGGRSPRTLADGLVGPLHLDVDSGWWGQRITVSQSFAGTISSVRNGKVTDLVSEPGGFTGGVAAGPFGTVMYLVGGESGAFLKMRLPDGSVRTIADLGTYEATRNPDQVNHYGIQGASPACLAELPPDIPELAPYTGDVNSNPYELAVTPFGTYVADAGGNDILFVEWSGRIRTVSVLPPRPMVIPPQAVALGLPACTIGLTMNFEPVPTDVEIGPDWQLYVSSLPGGPEDASLGARGGVFRVDPLRGRSRLIGEGFLGATNLAVAPNGTIYVAELFGGRISKLTRNGPQTVLQVTDPAALEWSGGRLYATSDVNGSGKVISFRP